MSKARWNDRWQRVVEATRLHLKGESWWAIRLSCGHSAAVLHGPLSPLDQRVQCFYGFPEAEAQ